MSKSKIITLIVLSSIIVLALFSLGSQTRLLEVGMSTGLKLLSKGIRSLWVRAKLSLIGGL